jgi:putative acetyltransferase
MKRLFVRPAFRNHGLGRSLAEAAMLAGRELGYTLMRLDTLASMTKAVALYESLGFRRTSAYYNNPLPDVVYFEARLQK